MYLDKIKLRNYRNYANELFSLSPGMNIIIGDNGEGKTNLLEAVYLLSTTRSHRNENDRELILFNEDFATVEGLVNYGQKKDRLSVVLHKKGKTLLVNNVPVRKNSEFIGKLNAVLFEPGDMNLFDDSPRVRRRLIDIEMGKLSTLYMYNLSMYLKYLKERNALLKTDVDKIMLEIHTEQLIEPQIRIIKERARFINNLNSYISYFFNQISGGSHKINIVYRSIIKEKDNEDIMKQQIQQSYAASQDRDLMLKQTNLGIHREDYEFYLDGKEVSKYCSQGQKRMIILALKLAFVQIIFQIKKEYPILLLDDVLSELDSKRRSRLMKLLPNSIQTVITTTDYDEIKQLKKKNVNLIRIVKGRIEDGSD